MSRFKTGYESSAPVSKILPASNIYRVGGKCVHVFVVGRSGGPCEVIPPVTRLHLASRDFCACIGLVY